MQLGPLYRIPVRRFDAIDAVALGGEDVAVERETVGWPWHFARHDCAEAVAWDLLVGVVVLQDVAHGAQGLQVLVLGVVCVVQGLRVVDWAVRHREVDRDVQVDLAAAENVLEEVHCAGYLKAVDVDGVLLFSGCDHLFFTFELLKISVKDAEDFVVAAGIRPVDFDLDLLLFVLVAQHSRIDEAWVPFLLPSLLLLELRFKYGLVLSRGEQLPNNKEDLATLRKVSGKLDLCGLTANRRGHLLGLDLHRTVLLPSRIIKREIDALINGCHDLVKLEFHLTDILLCIQIVRLVPVLHIVGLQQKRLRLLEEVVYLYLRNEVRVQVIVNALGLAYLLPQHLAALLLHRVQHDERVRLREGVEIGETSQREGKTEVLLQLRRMCVADTSLDCLQGRIVDVLASFADALGADGL